MDASKKIELELKDVYQMLISECRYGYTRNNHLMPSGAYDKVKRIIPQMYKVDKEYAIYTLKQICEECITDELDWHFYDSPDDEFNNKAESIEFIKWCFDYIYANTADFDKDWKPYCLDRFEANLEKGSCNKKRYRN